MSNAFEKTFPDDVMTKKERVLATLRHEPVDRCALHEQLGYNPRVIAMYTGREITGFDYTRDDVCEVIRKTMDVCFPPGSPRGTARRETPDGFVYQDDNWTTWRVAKPFDDADGAMAYLRKMTARVREGLDAFDADRARENHHSSMEELQEKVGETVIMDLGPSTGLCTCYDTLGLDLFSYVHADAPEAVHEFIELSTTAAERRIRAVADPDVTPVALVPDDFATKQGPIFSPDFLGEHFFPFLARLAAAWKENGVAVIFHSDGNWKKVIPQLVACGVDGFYCLEPNCGMDIVELKTTWPEMVWAGGVDGVDLMEFGEPEQVREEVRRHIHETDALRTGGMLVATSSEVNPPIKPENFRAMVEAVGEFRNPEFG